MHSNYRYSWTNPKTRPEDIKQNGAISKEVKYFFHRLNPNLKTYLKHLNEYQMK